jgi:phage terminase Nu1 subunit (DNA packaging protein)
MAAASHSLKTISKLLDLSPRRVQQLVKEGVIPKMERGRYELVPVVRAYIHYLRERNIQAGVVSLEEVRTRKIKAEAELAEIDLAQQRGETINVDAAAIVWASQKAGCFRSRPSWRPSSLSRMRRRSARR